MLNDTGYEYMIQVMNLLQVFFKKNKTLHFVEI